MQVFHKSHITKMSLLVPLLGCMSMSFLLIEPYVTDAASGMLSAKNSARGKWHTAVLWIPCGLGFYPC